MDCLFRPTKTWFLPHTMPPDLPTKILKEIHVEMHLVPVDRPSKSLRHGNDKDGKKVIIDSHQNNEDMASTQISTLQKSLWNKAFPGWPNC